VSVWRIARDKGGYRAWWNFLLARRAVVLAGIVLAVVLTRALG
jgi:hypothetical protein